MIQTYVHSKIICGKCKCEYCPGCHEKCPQCGTGMNIQTTTTTFPPQDPTNYIYKS